MTGHWKRPIVLCVLSAPIDGAVLVWTHLAPILGIEISMSLGPYLILETFGADLGVKISMALDPYLIWETFGTDVAQLLQAYAMGCGWVGLALWDRCNGGPFTRGAGGDSTSGRDQRGSGSAAASSAAKAAAAGSAQATSY